MNDNRKKKNLHTSVAVDTLFTLTLFLVFSSAVLLVMLSGAKVYQRTAASSEENGNVRTANTYLVSKVRHFDSSDPDSAIRIETADGGDKLILHEVYDGTPFETCIYCADGYLCELFYDPADGFDPALGEKILAANSLHIEAEDNLLRFSVSGGAQAAVYAAVSPEVFEK